MPESFSTKVLIFALLILVFVTGFNFFQRPFSKEKQDGDLNKIAQLEVTPTLQNKSLTEIWQEKLTKEEKIWQLIAFPLLIEENLANQETNASASSQLALIKANKPGFIAIYGKKIALKTLQETIKQVLEQYPVDYPRPIFMVDHEGGSTQRLDGDGFTPLPSWQKLCALTKEKALIYLDQSARELSLAGIDLVMAPVIDVGSRSGVMKDRLCSGDQALVTEFGTSYVQSFLAHGVIPVLKHYPGIGSVSKDLHLQFDRISVTQKSIMPFDQILNSNPDIGVMVAHVGVIGKNENQPCSQSQDCLLALSENYPKALVLSDDLGMKAASYGAQTLKYDQKLSEVMSSSLLAGVQVLLFAPGFNLSLLEEAVMKFGVNFDQQPEFKEKIDQALERVLLLKQDRIK